MAGESRDHPSTRDRIMRALAEEVLERGPHDFSVQGVADRAGITHRTVYRYFPSREDLFHAYGSWLNGQLGEGANETPKTIRSLAVASGGAFRRFERVPQLSEAYVRIIASGAAVATRSERTKSFVAIVDRDACALDERHRLALAAVLRQTVSSEMWARSREQFGVTGDELGDVVGWIVDLVGDALESGQAPKRRQGESE